MSGPLVLDTTPPGADGYYRIRIQQEGFETLHRVHTSVPLFGGRTRPGAGTRLPSNLTLVPEVDRMLEQAKVVTRDGAYSGTDEAR